MKFEIFHTHTHKRIYDVVKLKINYMAILNLVRRHIPVVLIAMTVIFLASLFIVDWWHHWIVLDRRQLSQFFHFVSKMKELDLADVWFIQDTKCETMVRLSGEYYYFWGG